MNLHPADAIVLVVYLIGITVLGAWMGRKVSSSADYFMPRRFGKLTMIMHAFGTGTASDQAVIVASATARNGLSGIWFQWMWLFPTPFYWLIAPIMPSFPCNHDRRCLRTSLQPKRRDAVRCRWHRGNGSEDWLDAEGSWCID